MESNKVWGDGIVTGHGKINGRTVFAYANDFTSLGGSLSKTVSEKICKVIAQNCVDFYNKFLKREGVLDYWQNILCKINLNLNSKSEIKKQTN